MRTVIAGATVLTCDDRHTIYSPGDVVMEDDRIAYVGARYDGDCEVRLPCVGKLVMPGLVNTHTHSSMSIFRSLADDVDLMVFLQDRVWPREIMLTGEDVYAGSVLSGVEMLKCGITSYVDMYFYEEDLVRAALDVGIRAMVGPAILDSPAWTPMLGTWEQRTESVLQFCRKWDGYEGRIHAAFGPHAPYTLPLEALREIGSVARHSGYPITIHLVETRQERDNFNAQGLGSTASALRDIEFFDARVIAAHSIWVDPGDVEIYQLKGVGVAHCPQSNAKLGAGVAPVAAMLQAGVQVGLGTDGAATNNNHDLWEELRLAPLLAKALALDPTVLPAPVALWMATSMGARAAHLSGVGVLEEGRKADLLMLDIQDTTAVPVFGPETYIAHAVYSLGSRAVDCVWVNGRQVVRAGEVLTVDEAEACRIAQDVAVNIATRVGV